MAKIIKLEAWKLLRPKLAIRAVARWGKASAEIEFNSWIITSRGRVGWLSRGYCAQAGVSVWGVGVRLTYPMSIPPVGSDHRRYTRARRPLCEDTRTGPGRAIFADSRQSARRHRRLVCCSRRGWARLDAARSALQAKKLSQDKLTFTLSANWGAKFTQQQQQEQQQILQHMRRISCCSCSTWEWFSWPEPHWLSLCSMRFKG